MAGDEQADARGIHAANTQEQSATAPGAKVVKLRCSFCKIVFDCPDFVAVAQVQSEDCYITRVGIKHKLSEVPRDG